MTSRGEVAFGSFSCKKTESLNVIGGLLSEVTNRTQHVIHFCLTLGILICAEPCGITRRLNKLVIIKITVEQNINKLLFTEDTNN